MTLQQLRYVTAVAGTGTISHAVQQFYISQPSLTNAIRELEQEVGLALSKTASSVVSRTLLDARGQMSAKSMHPPAYGQRKCQKKKGVQEKMKHLHKGGWCHPHSTRRLAFCRGCRIRQNTTPAKGALPGRLSPSTAALKTHRPRLRSAAMKAPVGNALFVGIKVGRTTLAKVMPYMLMYYAAIILGLLLVTYIPAVSMVLPQVTGLV